MASNPPRILLLGPVGDPQIAEVSRALERGPATPLRVDSRSALRLTWTPAAPERSEVAGVPLSSIRGGLIRALPPRSSTLPEALSGPVSAETWVAGRMEGDARRDTLAAILAWLARHGRPLLNPPRPGGAVDNKPEQLARACALGLRVPDTRVTSDVEQARAALRAWSGAVVKPVRGGSYAERLSLDDEGRLAAVVRAPVIFQEEVRGADIRVVLLDGAVLSAARVEGTTSLDFRADPVYQRGEATYREVSLDEGLVAGLARLQRELSLPFAGVDLKEAEGGMVFLEMNGAPVYLEQARALGHDVSGSVARYLQAEGAR